MKKLLGMAKTYASHAWHQRQNKRNLKLGRSFFKRTVDATNNFVPSNLKADLIGKFTTAASKGIAGINIFKR